MVAATATATAVATAAAAAMARAAVTARVAVAARVAVTARAAPRAAAAGGVTTDPPLGRCPCREPPETLSLLLANRHGRFEIAGFHYEN